MRRKRVAAVLIGSHNYDWEATIMISPFNPLTLSLPQPLSPLLPLGPDLSHCVLMARLSCNGFPHTRRPCYVISLAPSYASLTAVAMMWTGWQVWCHTRDWRGWVPWLEVGRNLPNVRPFRVMLGTISLMYEQFLPNHSPDSPLPGEHGHKFLDLHHCLLHHEE